MTVKKVGLLGGTFDPPHIGHLVMAEEARLEKSLDEIWWMPNPLPPHKEISSATSEENRRDLVKKMVDCHPAFRLCTFEMECSRPSYTTETVRALMKEMPTIQFSFIMGGDSLENFHKWYKYEELSQLLPFIVLTRPGYEIAQPTLFRELTVIKNIKLDVSSTEIRKKIKDGSLNRFLLTDAVYEYIREYRLYE
ncbi:nicotinate (nicotinamide) nucleotide adenylyltransferase [Salipaludibacillus sp. LMS25]|jgi:nicotinate-nucleotide adenylyltransferase|uniref:nicotinate (nicotinamide) nucleotide adenylyltransferase n=1 Tax=Salipaludibacillus sp. LMS25 TaxID=2924031 RepID=UPI0020D18ED7|nr:nicotinate (nicotinamide) nucleotide adenylyltransferase [Salipaludibacillus sp. LMS25]UTR14346.1 nicotinate (nicotinamide) nucleotide adenylyltransferase [Salipaludibacillus sp. LMS25]